MNTHLIIAGDHVGSRVTCNPPPTDTDDDWLYLVTDIVKFVDEAKREGYYVDGSLMGGRNWGEDNFACQNGIFVSLKHANDISNLIVTSSQDFYSRFIAATYVCKRLNLLHKPDRIALFQAVLYGVRYGQ